MLKTQRATFTKTPKTMKKTILLLCIALCSFHAISQKVFDVHLHGDPDPAKQLENLAAAGVYKTAVSSSWNLQQKYQNTAQLTVLHGLMFPCPEAKVPYSLQFCFENQAEFPDIIWVENLMKEGKIQFIGEILSQYYGISPSDEKLFPYYALAEKYGIPVGIHTGLAGPNHGSPNFKVSLGKPILMENLLQKFPKLKVWIMHAGAPFLEETIALMKYYPNVYIDISAINNPYIFPKQEFQNIIKTFIDAGFEDRIMFGSDNGDIKLTIENVENLDFLTSEQKEKIFYKNAEIFFQRNP